MDKQRFLEAQERARKLISMDAKGGLDKYAKAYADSGGLSVDSNGDFNFGNLSESMTNKVNHNTAAPTEFAPSQFATSKLPKEILESMKTTQIDTRTAFGGGSVLDQYGLIPNEIKQNPIKQIVTEEKAATSTQTVTNNGAIDYSLIKTIVEDCVRKSMGSLKKSILQEGKENVEDNNVALMKIGESFKFVTKNGDIYEARLKKISNIYDKKKTD